MTTYRESVVTRQYDEHHHVPEGDREREHWLIPACWCRPKVSTERDRDGAIARRDVRHELDEPGATLDVEEAT